MVVTTRASVGRCSTSPLPSQSRGKTTETRPISEEPQTLRSKKRSRKSLDQLPLRPLNIGRSEAQSLVGRAELTWQQQELLNPLRSRQHRRTRSTASNANTPLSSTANLPVLRVTSDLQIVSAAATELPRPSRRARRSLPSPRSIPQTHVPRSTNNASKLYAEPSCFRAPLPQSLPLPCFTKSIKSVAAALT